jgi:hypothetical protein
MVRLAFAFKTAARHRRRRQDLTMESAGGLPLRRPLRNANLSKIGVLSLAVGAFLLVANVLSGFGLGWFGIGLLSVFALVGAVYMASWWRATVEVEDDGIRVGGLMRDRFVPWNEIDCFEIRAPHCRTPFMLAFGWWLDQAVARLSDGSVLKLRAIQPWHGFTVLTYFSVSSWTDADDVVETLNRLCQEGRDRDTRRGSRG